MVRFRLSALAWRWLVCCSALLSGILLVIEFSHAVGPLLIKGEQGGIGVVLVDQVGANQHGQGTHRLRIESLAPASPLLAAGAAPGDYLRFDRFEDRWRKFAVGEAGGEAVGLTLYQGGAAHRLSLVARPEKIRVDEYVDYGGRLLIALPALLFGLMIGLKQSEGRSYRALSMTFILLSLMYFYSFSYSPAGSSFLLSKFLCVSTYSLIWYGCAVFALYYQPYPPSRLRTWLMRLLPAYRLLAYGTALYSIGFASGRETPLLWLGTLLGGVSGLAMVVVSLTDGWRRSVGEIRQRHLWLLLSIALGAIPGVLTLIPALDATIGGVRVTVLMYFAGQLLMYMGLAYAVLQYRVFNFDFAISRALVFSVVSVMLVCSFGLIEWFYASVMHGGGGHGAGKKSLWLDAGLALVAYLVFHKIHGTLERWVERILFEKWHNNERKLRSFVRQAAQFTAVDALLPAFRGALDQFSDQAGCAIYLRQENGQYARVAASLEGAAALVDSNDGMVIALRTDAAPVLLDQLQAPRGAELALPMCHRGMLDGFVLMGRKRRGASYRPDECDALAFAAFNVGLDLHALRVDQLEREVIELEHKTGQQSKELQLMAGRRRSIRDVTEPQPASHAVSA